MSDRRINAITPELADLAHKIARAFVSAREAQKDQSPGLEAYHTSVYNACFRFQEKANDGLHRDDETLPDSTADIEEYRQWAVALIKRIIEICKDERDNVRVEYSLEHQSLEAALSLLEALAPESVDADFAKRVQDTVDSNERHHIITQVAEKLRAALPQAASPKYDGNGILIKETPPKDKK